MKQLLILGLGDFARVARFYFEHDSDWEVVGFTATTDVLNQRDTEERDFGGLPVVAFEDLAKSHPPGECALFIGIAYSDINRNRQRLFEKATALGYELPSYVCSKATTWPDLKIGRGSFVFEANVIQPFVEIGENTVLWSGNHIGHDSIIGDHVFIASHVVVSGNCRIGDNTFVGVNATLRDGIAVGSRCVIGAGALLLQDAPDETVFKGRASEPRGYSSAQLKKI